MYFNPTAAQVAASRASTCGMATPKDPSDCHKGCGNYAGGPCAHYRPRVAAEPVIVAPLSRICPNHRYAMLDDGMGNLARYSGTSYGAALYHATTGVSS